MKHADGAGSLVADGGTLRLGAESPMTGSERWMVAMSGPLSVINGDFADSVYTGQGPEVLRLRLCKTVDIGDRAGFERAARWFVEEGDRRTYRVLWRLVLRSRAAVQRMPLVVRKTLGERAPAVAQARLYSKKDYELVGRRLGMSAAEVRQKLDAARSWAHLLEDNLRVRPEGVENLVAWDAARLVGITRWAIGAGYIERDEFEKFAGGLARRVQEVYQTWADFSAAYLVGGLIWNSAPGRRVQLSGSVRMLNIEPRSPFLRISFR